MLIQCYFNCDVNSNNFSLLCRQCSYAAKDMCPMYATSQPSQPHLYGWYSPHCLCSCLRSAPPFLHPTPLPGSDKEEQLIRSALCPCLSTAFANVLLFSLQSTPFSTLFLLSSSCVFCRRLIQIMFPDWPPVRMYRSDT